MNKKTVVIAAGTVHPNLMCVYRLQQLLREKKQNDYIFSTKLSSLTDLANDQFSSVVLYFQKKSIPEPYLEALERFVFNGGGLLALHSASASFKQNQRYFNLIGGRFIKHGKISEFKVEVADTQSAIYKGIPRFSVRDELYIHEYQNDVQVHFSTKVGDKTEPVVWTRELGKGKITYCSLGHCAPVLKNQHVKSIIYQSLDWMDHRD
jgi:type 1 glutamine amidotransferase